MIQKFVFKELEMKGAYEITPFYATDERGGFVKDYNIDIFNANADKIDASVKDLSNKYNELYLEVNGQRLRGINIANAIITPNKLCVNFLCCPIIKSKSGAVLPMNPQINDNLSNGV